MSAAASRTVVPGPWFEPRWPLPPNVRSLITTRDGGASSGVYASFNLGTHVGDVPARVAANRARLTGTLPAEPHWLRQVHGTQVLDIDQIKSPEVHREDNRTADGAVTRTRGHVLVIQTADCLPVLLCAHDGSAVGAVHAGWRGLCDGVIESAVGALRTPGEPLLAYLGPAIGPDAYEVGEEVRAAFVARDARAADAFRANARGRWQADLYVLARQRLAGVGVSAIYGGGYCTSSERERFFSYRRDGTTGRMASLIWIA